MVADEVHNCLEVHQWLAAPIEANEWEEAMLNLAPFARAGWIVTDADRLADLVRQELESESPPAEFRTTVAAPLSAQIDRRATSRYGRG